MMQMKFSLTPVKSFLEPASLELMRIQYLHKAKLFYFFSCKISAWEATPVLQVGLKGVLPAATRRTGAATRATRTRPTSRGSRGSRSSACTSLGPCTFPAATCPCVRFAWRFSPRRSSRRICARAWPSSELPDMDLTLGVEWLAWTDNHMDNRT